MKNPVSPPKNRLIVFRGINLIGAARVWGNASGTRWVPQSISPQRVTFVQKTHGAFARCIRATPAADMPEAHYRPAR
jgi:hypothetical protein